MVIDARKCLSFVRFNKIVCRNLIDNKYEKGKSNRNWNMFQKVVILVGKNPAILSLSLCSNVQFTQHF